MHRNLDIFDWPRWVLWCALSDCDVMECLGGKVACPHTDTGQVRAPPPPPPTHSITSQSDSPARPIKCIKVTMP